MTVLTWTKAAKQVCSREGLPRASGYPCRSEIRKTWALHHGIHRSSHHLSHPWLMLGHRRKSSGTKPMDDGGILFGLAAGEIFFRSPVFWVTLRGVKSDSQIPTSQIIEEHTEQKSEAEVWVWVTWESWPCHFCPRQESGKALGKMHLALEKVSSTPE